MSSVVPDFVMIAFSMEDESANHFPHPIIVGLKILSPVDVAQILGQGVTAASDNQVKNVGSASDADVHAELQLHIRNEVQNIGGDQASNQKESSDEGLAVVGVFLWSEMVELFGELLIFVWVGVVVVHILRERVVVVGSVGVLVGFVGELRVLVIEEGCVHADKSCINKKYGEQVGMRQANGEKKRDRRGIERMIRYKVKKLLD